jgi:hypothetical protein
MSCCLEIKLQSEQQNNMNIGAKWDELEPEDWHRLAAQWLQELRAQEPDKESGVQRTVVLMNFTASAEAQWTFILAAIAQARSDDELGHIAAGPLEHLLGWHGPQFIGRVEQQADQDPAFARAVTGVWKYLMADVIWLRVEAIKNSVPDPLQPSPKE